MIHPIKESQAANLLHALLVEQGHLALHGVLYPRATYTSQSMWQKRRNKTGCRVRDVQTTGVLSEDTCARPTPGEFRLAEDREVSDRDTAFYGHSEQGTTLTPIPWKEALVTDKLAS